MGIFDLFTTSQEKKVKELLSNKPQCLMHTSTAKQDKIYSIKPSINSRKPQPVVFATDNEKIAILYTLYPFYYFEFGNGEIGAIILGKNHNLLQIDKTVGYIHYVDSTSFTPEVSEQGYFKNEWFSTNEVLVRKDIPPKKVTFDDVLKEGIQVFWVKDRATMMAIDKETSQLTSGDLKLEFLVNQTNWTPEKFMYINAYKNICEVTQTDKGWIVNRGNTINNTVIQTPQQTVQNTNPNPPQNNVQQPSPNMGYNTNYQNNIPNTYNFPNQKILNGKK